MPRNPLADGRKLVEAGAGEQGDVRTDQGLDQVEHFVRQQPVVEHGVDEVGAIDGFSWRADDLFPYLQMHLEALFEGGELFRCEQGLIDDEEPLVAVLPHSLSTQSRCHRAFSVSCDAPCRRASRL